MMKNLLYIFCIIILGLVINIFVEKYQNYLGNGYNYAYFKAEESWIHGNDIFITYIIKYKYSDNYIITISPKESKYECQGNMIFLPYVIDKMQYSIIDKNKHKKYSTTDKQKFNNMKKELNISLKLNLGKKDIQKYKKVIEYYSFENTKKYRDCIPILVEENGKLK